ncbi:hypothetical protein AMAG_18679 [Allomyces macrogynus ATCC 38327]|uniref:Uncharacterized protein n=1 Tax=Allomyces macrogynus (strain ATCC 38327) TaxID=578462 RepID=A0A0L0SH93_ALLM3|nr:hypothetical protein AMAG_18679 [Allomyces macrogynus ATCC 38327]|eukprot:KNE61740.1 hypothetical protein AMAG_18679 [Allomyces macrogynus ATCC 38327]
MGHTRLHGQVRDLEAELAGLQRARAVREARILAAEHEMDAAAAAAAAAGRDMAMDVDGEDGDEEGGLVGVPRAADAPWWGGRWWPPPPRGDDR